MGFIYPTLRKYSRFIEECEGLGGVVKRKGSCRWFLPLWSQRKHSHPEQQPAVCPDVGQWCKLWHPLGRAARRCHAQYPWKHQSPRTLGPSWGLPWITPKERVKTCGSKDLLRGKPADYVCEEGPPTVVGVRILRGETSFRGGQLGAGPGQGRQYALGCPEVEKGAGWGCPG